MIIDGFDIGETWDKDLLQKRYWLYRKLTMFPHEYVAKKTGIDVVYIRKFYNGFLKKKGMISLWKRQKLQKYLMERGYGVYGYDNDF